MYISTLDIQQTLDAQLATVVYPSFADIPAPDIFPENIRAYQQGTTPFIRSTLGPAKSIISSLGINKIIKQQGLYQVDVFVPIDYSYIIGRTFADAIIAAFPPGFLTLQSGSNLIINTAWSGPALNDYNSFLMTPVKVDWWIEV